MESESTLRLLIPLIPIAIGIWLKITKTEEVSILKIKKYWLLLIILGIFNLSFNLYEFLGS